MQPFPGFVLVVMLHFASSQIWPARYHDSARSASECERNCFELGTCTRVMSRPAITRLGVLAWCLLALGVFVTEQGVRRSRA